MSDRRLLDAHMRTSFARSAALGSLLTRAGRTLGYDSDRFVSLAVDAVLAAQTTQALATWSLFDLMGERSDPLGRRLEADPPIDVMIGAATHDGTPLETVYRRPGKMLAAELALEGGLELALARAKVDREVALMADADLFVSGRKAEQTFAQVDRRIVGYRRVPNGGACDWCLYIATQRYTVDTLAPAHRDCHCGTEPIYGIVDPGPVLDPEGLAAIKKRGVPRRAGSRKAAAKRANAKIANPKIPTPAAPKSIAESMRPTAASRPGQSTMNYTDKKSEAFAPWIDQLDELHGVADDGYAPDGVAVRFGGKTTSKGGHFAPLGENVRRPPRKRGETRDEWLDRYRAKAEAAKGPKILVNDRGDGTGLLSFLHEYGHRVDYDADRGGMNFHSATARPGTELGDAFGSFLSAATDSDHFRESASRATRSGLGYASYFRSPEEVWARAYSQWAAQKLGGDASAALDAMLDRNPYYQWPRDHFEAEIAPQLEAVLRARGLTE